MFTSLKLLLSEDTTCAFCHHCDHFSGNTRFLIFKKRFKWLRIKYWKFLFYKINLKRQGYCAISVINANDDQEHLIMTANERCIFNGVKDNIVDAKRFINKLPDDPERIIEVIEQIESSNE